MKNISDIQLQEILKNHSLYLSGNGGELADLSDTDLSGVDLSHTNLSYANLRGVDLSDANLRYTNLIGAKMRGANLSYANLSCTIGNMKNIKSIFTDTYQITYTSDYLQIECHRHLIDEWWSFDDRKILEMDGRKALKFRNRWKETIRNIIELSPAEPTK